MRRRWTHELTASRPVTVDANMDNEPDRDAYGAPTVDTPEPSTDTAPVVDSVPVQYRPGDEMYVRESTGERTMRSPTVVGQHRLSDLEVGDVVDLSPLDPDGQTYTNLEVRSVKVLASRSAHGNGAEVTLEAL